MMRKAVRRGHARGAVFVESVIVISMLILFTLGISFFNRLYVEKQRIARLARAAAIAHSMGACDGDPTAPIKSDLPKGQSGKSDQGNEPPPTKYETKGNSQQADEALKATGNDNNSFVNPTTTVTVNGKASSTTQDKGKKQGFTVDVASASYVSCSDETTNDDFAAVIDKIGGVISSIFK